MRRRTQLRRLSVLTLLVVTFIVMSACDDSGESPADDTSTDTPTAGDTTSDDTQTGDTALDVDDAQDTQAPQDTSDTDTMRAGLEEPCAEHIDCQRGLICGGLCVEAVGCALDRADSDGLGCLIEARNGGLLTAAECEADADCANSPYGPTCIRHVCTSRTPCQDDSACTAPETCYEEQVCLP